MLKRLLKWLLRTIAISLAFLLIVAVSQYISHRYHPGSVMVVELNGPVVERGGNSVLGILNNRATPLNVLGRALNGAAKDPRFVGLAIKIIDPQMELAQAQEISGMIADFKSHGKWTTAYMETAGEGGFGNLPYLVASATDEVSMMPEGDLNLLGVGIREVFARGFFDWLRIKPNFDAIGEYKTAANIFTQKDFTPAQLEEDTALVGGMFNQIVGATAKHRHLSPDDIRSIIDRAPLSAQAGLKAHLLDRLEYEDQFDDRVRNYRGEHHELVDYQAYARPTIFSSLSRAPRIAVIYGVGAIDRGEGGFDPLLSPGSSAMGSDQMVKAFKDAREDSDVRAVVLRVNSPGGSVIASELIRRAVELCAKKKPVVVSMSGYAASGGYWISTPAAKIFADPGTLTGSIGVLGGKFNISGAVDALGINSASVTRGSNSEMFDSFTDFTPEQQQIFRNRILGDTYQRFVSLVASSRHLTVQRVDQLAQGRVWTGDQAVQNKLVDEIGGFEAAVREARVLAKIPASQSVKIEELPQPPGLLDTLFGSQVMSRATAEWRPPRTFAPILWMMQQTLLRRQVLGQVYCPLVPVM